MLQRFESEGSGVSERRHAFWGVWQYIRPLRRWIKEQRRRAQGKCALAAQPMGAKRVKPNACGTQMRSAEVAPLRLSGMNDCATLKKLVRKLQRPLRPDHAVYAHRGGGPTPSKVGGARQGSAQKGAAKATPSKAGVALCCHDAAAARRLLYAHVIVNETHDFGGELFGECRCWCQRAGIAPLDNFPTTSRRKVMCHHWHLPRIYCPATHL